MQRPDVLKGETLPVIGAENVPLALHIPAVESDALNSIAMEAHETVVVLVFDLHHRRLKHVVKYLEGPGWTHAREAQMLPTLVTQAIGPLAACDDMNSR